MEEINELEIGSVFANISIDVAVIKQKIRLVHRKTYDRNYRQQTWDVKYKKIPNSMKEVSGLSTFLWFLVL